MREWEGGEGGRWEGGEGGRWEGGVRDGDWRVE